MYMFGMGIHVAQNACGNQRTTLGVNSHLLPCLKQDSLFFVVVVVVDACH